MKKSGKKITVTLDFDEIEYIRIALASAISDANYAKKRYTKRIDIWEHEQFANDLREICDYLGEESMRQLDEIWRKNKTGPYKNT